MSNIGSNTHLFSKRFWTILRVSNMIPLTTTGLYQEKHGETSYFSHRPIIFCDYITRNMSWEVIFGSRAVGLEV